MTDPTPPVAAGLGDRFEKVFPTLTPAQIARIAAHGRPLRVASGEILVEPGQRSTRFFVVREGQVQIVRLSPVSEVLLAVCGPGQFTGEVNMLSGNRSVVLLRASEAGELIELDRERLLALVQTDSELATS